MRLAFAALALLLAGPVAQAQAPRSDAAVERLIRGSYAHFIPDQDAPEPKIPLTPGLRTIETQCRAMQGRVEKRDGTDAIYSACANDYNVLCQCQDMGATDWSRIGIAITHPTPGRLDAAVRFPPVDGKAAASGPAIVWRFVRRGAGWVVSDFHEREMAGDGIEPSYRTRLVQSIQEMRATLGLPKWKAPAN